VSYVFAHERYTSVEALESLPAESIRALKEAIAQCIRRGDCRERIRAELIGAGLSAATVDQLLAGVPNPILRSMGSVAVVVVSLIVLAALPVVGAVGGFSLAWFPATGEVCGMWVFPALFVAACGGLLGLAAGVGFALAVVWCLSTLSAGTKGFGNSLHGERIAKTDQPRE
jgi:hypothetical protein